MIGYVIASARRASWMLFCWMLIWAVLARSQQSPQTAERIAKGRLQGVDDDGHHYQLDYDFAVADNVWLDYDITGLLDAKCQYNASTAAFKFIPSADLAIAIDELNSMHELNGPRPSKEEPQPDRQPHDNGAKPADSSIQSSINMAATVPQAGMHRVLLYARTIPHQASGSSSGGGSGSSSSGAKHSEGSAQDFAPREPPTDAVTVMSIAKGGLIVLNTAPSQWPSCYVTDNSKATNPSKTESASRPKKAESAGQSAAAEDRMGQKQAVLRVHALAIAPGQASAANSDEDGSSSKVTLLEMLVTFEEHTKAYKHLKLELNSWHPEARKQQQKGSRKENFGKGKPMVPPRHAAARSVAKVQGQQSNSKNPTTPEDQAVSTGTMYDGNNKQAILPLLDGDLHRHRRHQPPASDQQATAAGAPAVIARMLLSEGPSLTLAPEANGGNCSAGCATCSGSGQQQCITCQQGYTLKAGMFGSGYCYECQAHEQCAPGEYCDMPLLVGAQWTCRPCPSDCKTCTPTGECTACWSASSLLPTGRCGTCPARLMPTSSDNTIWPYAHSSPTPSIVALQQALPVPLNSSSAQQELQLGNVVLTQICLKRAMQRPQLWVGGYDHALEVYVNRTYDLPCMADAGCYPFEDSIALLLPGENVRMLVLEEEQALHISRSSPYADKHTWEYLNNNAFWLPNPDMFPPSRNYSVVVNCQTCNASITLYSRGCWDVRQREAVTGVHTRRKLLQSNAIQEVLAKQPLDIWNYDASVGAARDSEQTISDGFLTCVDCYMYFDVSLSAGYGSVLMQEFAEVKMDATIYLNIGVRLDTTIALTGELFDILGDISPLGQTLSMLASSVSPFPIDVYPGIKISFSVTLRTEVETSIPAIETGLLASIDVNAYYGQFPDGANGPYLSVVGGPNVEYQDCQGCDLLENGLEYYFKVGLKPKVSFGIFADALFGLSGGGASMWVSWNYYLDFQLLARTEAVEESSLSLTGEPATDNSCDAAHDVEYLLRFGIDETQIGAEVKLQALFGAVSYTPFALEPLNWQDTGVLIAPMEVYHACLLVGSGTTPADDDADPPLAEDPQTAEPPAAADVPTASPIDAVEAASAPGSVYTELKISPAPPPSPENKDATIAESKASAPVLQRVWNKNLNSSGEPIVLDALSMRPRTDGVTPTYAVCLQLCQKTPGCNAFVYCDSRSGCPGGCKQRIVTYPQVKELLPEAVDTPVLGFGPYPMYSTLCQPGKNGVPTDNYPFGICTLKIADDPGAPKFYEDSDEGAGWVSGTLDVKVAECLEFGGAFNVSAAACQACGELAGSPPECFQCITQVPVKQLQVLENGIAWSSYQELCQSCWKEPNPTACVKCLTAGGSACSAAQKKGNIAAPPPPKRSPPAPIKATIKAAVSPAAIRQPSPPRNGSSKGISSLSPRSSSTPSPPPTSSPTPSSTPPPPASAAFTMLPAEIVRTAVVSSAGPDLDKRTSVEVVVAVKGLSVDQFTIQRQMLFIDLVMQFSDVKSGGAATTLINNFTDGTTARGPSGRRRLGAATAPAWPDANTAAQKPGAPNMISAGRDRRLMQGMPAGVPEVHVAVETYGYTDAAGAQQAAAGLYKSIKNGAFGKAAASQSILKSYKDGDIQLVSDFIITERKPKEDKDPNKKTKLIIAVAAAAGAVFLLLVAAAIGYCCWAKRRGK